MENPNKYIIKHKTIKDVIINNFNYLLYTSWTILCIIINTNLIIYMNNFKNDDTNNYCLDGYKTLYNKLYVYSIIEKCFLVFLVIIFLLNKYLPKNIESYAFYIFIFSSIIVFNINNDIDSNIFDSKIFRVNCKIPKYYFLQYILVLYDIIDLTLISVLVALLILIVLAGIDNMYT